MHEHTHEHEQQHTHTHNHTHSPAHDKAVIHRLNRELGNLEAGRTMVEEGRA